MVVLMFGKMRLRNFIYYCKYAVFQQGFYAHYKSIFSSMNEPSAILRKKNFEKRARLVKNALEANSFYSKKYSDLGLSVSGILTEADFLKLPLLTKDDLREHGDEMLDRSVRAGRIRKSTTGGSTGKPTSVYHDLRYPLEVYKWRMLSMWGIQPADNMACVWRLTRYGTLSKLANMLLWWPTERVFLDASSMTDASIRSFVDRYNKVKPPIIYSYTGSMLHIAEVVHRLKLKIFKPKAIWVTSSPLSQSSRRYIEDVFGAPVYDQYACSEIFWVGAECEQQDGLHLNVDGRHVEILDEQGVPCPAGVEGRVVITDLHNYAFPLIRYDVGDRAHIIDADCVCGCKLPMMSQVKGRQTDMIKLKNGVCLDGDYLTTIFDDFPTAVSNFQVRQVSEDSIIIYYVSAGSDVADAVRSVNDVLNSKVKGGASVKLVATERIEHDKGKHRYVVSDVFTKS